VASYQSSVKPWLVQPIKKLLSAVGLFAEMGCALIRQLANWDNYMSLVMEKIHYEY